MAGMFITKLQYDRDVIGSNVWIVLTNPLVYMTSDGEKLTVPTGFRSDGASIPRIVWFLIGHPFGSYLESAVVHDFPYKNPNKWFLGTKNKRKRADWVILDAMTSQGIKKWRRKIMYRTLRMGGWMFWKPKKGIGVKYRKDF